MKVVNNRENVFDKPVDMHFFRDNSRYRKWKNQMEIQGKVTGEMEQLHLIKGM